MKPSEILTRAAALIEPEGKWCQGRYSDGHGAMCMLGAIGEVSGAGSHGLHDVVDIVLDAINHSSVSVWNDAPGRTQSEVVSALRAAAELAKQQETAA